MASLRSGTGRVYESSVSVVEQQITRKSFKTGHKYYNLHACLSGGIRLKNPIKHLEFSNWSPFSKMAATLSTGNSCSPTEPLQPLNHSHQQKQKTFH